MTKTKVLSLCSLIINLTNILFVIFSVLAFFIKIGNWEIMTYQQANCFKYFTIDSNIFMAIGSAILLPFNIISLTKDENKVPKWALIIKFCGVVAVTITLITVIVFLGPTQGFGYMYIENQLFLHLICPLLAIISFLFFDSQLKLKSWLTALISLIPISIYGNLYMIMVIGVTESNGGWEDFYGFTRGGFWPIVVLCMCASTILLGAGICCLHNKISNKIKT